MRQFSILFYARTGSSCLRAALNNHSNIVCANEGQFAPANRVNVDLIENIYPFVVSGYSGIKVPILLMNRYPLDHGFWEANVLYRPIIICTRNPLRSFISLNLVRGNGYNWNKVEYTQPVYIDILEAQRYILWALRTLRSFTNLSGQRILVLRYEDGVDVCYRRALEFIGVGYEPPNNNDLIKQTTLPLEELVINYDELCASSLGTFLKCDDISSLKDLCAIYLN